MTEEKKEKIKKENESENDKLYDSKLSNNRYKLMQIAQSKAKQGHSEKKFINIIQ
jgi:hypothetical protein